MDCNKNGRTYVNTCIPVPGAEAGNATYVVDLTHYTCGGRRICSNGAYPVGADLNYKVVGTPAFVGNKAYQVDVLITGTVTYIPYAQGCGCACPVTENIYATVAVPVTYETAPVVTAGEVVASPIILRDCCPITNAVSLVGSFNLAEAAAAAGNAGSKGK